MGQETSLRREIASLFRLAKARPRRRRAMAMAMAPCAGDPIVLVRDSFKHYIEAVLQHLTELQRRWHPVDVPKKWASSKQVEELAALCRECGLASAKAVVACDRVLRRQIQEPQKNCDRSRLEDSPAAATDQREELRQLMAKRLQRAFRGFQQRRRRSKQKVGKVLATSLVRCLTAQIQQSLHHWRSGVTLLSATAACLCALMALAGDDIGLQRRGAMSSATLGQPMGPLRPSLATVRWLGEGLAGPWDIMSLGFLLTFNFRSCFELVLKCLRDNPDSDMSQLVDQNMAGH
ncbi:hypothetical protein AK812_SmicGene43837 [Symbiodinium microadriaticum]|uniref:Uncharacterized protein n=1 Tax=Symbiodinium microadriaticum TaxID=2951 RepID=A0A1Q9BZZ5_SYMMI|nr:hypothetical protein AK812_SmicGene43837 [Symbiodinium microadriaticum]